MWFAFMTKAFGINEGLLPSDPKFDNISSKFINLERGLLIGSIAILGGFVVSLGTLEYWQAQSLGHLNPATLDAADYSRRHTICNWCANRIV